MEEATEVRSFNMEYRCPRCDKGHLQVGEMVIKDNEFTWDHNCDNPKCNYSQNFPYKYPYIRYEKL